MEMMDFVMCSFTSGKLETNYWKTNWSKEGIVSCVLQQKTLHLLLPLTELCGGQSTDFTVSEMRTGSKVIINLAENGYLFTFDDGTETPYSLYIHKEQVGGVITKEDVGLENVKVAVHTADGSEYEWPAVIDGTEVKVHG